MPGDNVNGGEMAVKAESEPYLHSHVAPLRDGLEAFDLGNTL